MDSTKTVEQQINELLDASRTNDRATLAELLPAAECLAWRLQYDGARDHLFRQVRRLVGSLEASLRRLNAVTP